MLEAMARSTLDGADALPRKWKALYAATPDTSVFMSWEWASAWLRTFGDEGTPLVIRVRDGTQLVAIAPFFLFRQTVRRPYSLLSFVGSNEAAADHLDVLSAPEIRAEASRAVAEYIAERVGRFDVIRLEGVTASSPIVDTLQHALGAVGRSGVTACPYIPLPPTWETYERTLDSRQRYNLRSRAKRLERDAGEVRFEEVRDEGGLARGLVALFRLHVAVRKNAGEGSTFATRRMFQFHWRAAHAALAANRLRLGILTAGGRPVAASYCLSDKGVVSFYQTGHDPRLRTFGPGSEVIAQSIRAAIAEGAHEFDFLRGDEDYKWQWTDASREDRSLVSAARPLGKLVVTLADLVSRQRARARA